MKPEKKSWIVRTKCVVLKEIYCENCTEEEARRNPFGYSTDEQEIEQVDWEIREIKENL